MATPGTGQRPRPSSCESAPMGTIPSGHWESWAGGDLRTCVQWPRAAELATGVGVLEPALLWSAHTCTGTPLMEAREGSQDSLAPGPRGYCHHQCPPALTTLFRLIGEQRTLTAARSPGKSPSQHPLVLLFWQLSFSSRDLTASSSYLQTFSEN